MYVQFTANQSGALAAAMNQLDGTVEQNAAVITFVMDELKTLFNAMMRIERVSLVSCPECGRDFDLSEEVDAEEWAYGHDCEA